ncbi:MAG TPA: hypothetical protein VFG46_28235 [Chryseolinea sp.]|nr:hypothetical protein [Chryseolinea sp.]
MIGPTVDVTLNIKHETLNFMQLPAAFAMSEFDATIGVGGIFLLFKLTAYSILAESKKRKVES